MDNFMKHTLAAGLLAGAMLSLSTGASAQFQNPEAAVKYRQSALTVMAAHFGRVGAMANGRAPFDAKVAADNIAIVETMSKLPWAGFTADTEKVTSRTKPEAYKEAAKFKELADKMQAEVVKLSAAGKTGNLDQIKAAFGGVGASCKACHDAYQVPRP
jgi:cytochrome c556